MININCERLQKINKLNKKKKKKNQQNNQQECTLPLKKSFITDIFRPLKSLHHH